MATRVRSAVSGTRDLMRIAYRTIAIGLSVAVPVGFVAYADHVCQSTGINWLGALGALAALSLVLATVVVAGRR
jgi:hypothetical protein